MIRLLAILLIHLACWPACGAELVYRGTWTTTKNRKREGEMSCAVTPVAKEAWRGHFRGTFQGAPFDYKVDFTGPAGNLKGTATVDGADYQWRGRMSREQFKANFSGVNYSGSFDLKRVEQAVSAPPRSRQSR